MTPLEAGEEAWAGCTLELGGKRQHGLLLQRKGKHNLYSLPGRMGNFGFDPLQV